MNPLEIFRRNLARAVEASCIEVALTAQTEHRYEQKQGRLKDAVQTKFTMGGLVGRVYLDTGIAPYAVPIHEGIRPHMIFPKRRKALRWVKGSDFVFSKRARFPGWQKDPFLYDALRTNEQKINDIFDRYTERAVQEVSDAFSS